MDDAGRLKLQVVGGVDAEDIRGDALAIDQRLGRNLRHLRRASRSSQAQLGAALGISFQQVQKYERGSNRLSVSMMCAAAQFLDVPIAELLLGLANRSTASLSPKPTGVRLQEIARLIACMTPERQRLFEKLALAMADEA